MEPRNSCCVFVLGDFGRSPRMQYHTESLLKKGLNVTVIAFEGSTPLSSLTSNPSYRLSPVPKTPEWINSLPRLLYYITKTLFQFLYLLYAVLFMEKVDFLLVQNPPAIPTLFICIAAKYIRGIPFVLDWHNYAFSLMQLNSRSDSVVVKIAAWIETNLSRVASGHLCVSKAMKEELKGWKINADVVYDRPHSSFRQATIEETHQLFLKLKPVIQSSVHPYDICTRENSRLEEGCTLLTRNSGGKPDLRTERPAVIVSSTSWTPDEDFSLLLSALTAYDRAKTDSHPWLLVFITGKGPLKERYVSKLQQLDLRSVAVRTVWLEPDDYPVLLGSATLGISLHTSSSGVDLPMKVVDMFGCALPVCSPSYPAITELISPENTGFLFHDSNELTKCLQQLLLDFPSDKILAEMRKKIKFRNHQGWDENWNLTVWTKLAKLFNLN